MIRYANYSPARLRHRLIATAILLASAVAPGAAVAGECPAVKTGGDLTKLAPVKPKGVTDTVLRTIDLSKEAIKLDNRQFRIRRLEITPGGVVPLHQHGDRPALIYIIKGTMTEYSSNCSVPIEHKPGDAAMESVGLAHWWKNNSSETAVLISADILHTAKEEGDVM